MPAPKGLGALALTDADAAGRKLRAAIRLLRGDLARVAWYLGVARVTLHKWLARFPGGAVPGGKGQIYLTCRAWLDVAYPQTHDPRKLGRRRATEQIDAGTQTGP